MNIRRLIRSACFGLVALSVFASAARANLPLLLGCIDIITQPEAAGSCDPASAHFSIEVQGTGPFTYMWQVQLPGGAWQFLGNDPGPIRCPQGGSGFAYATPINSPAVKVGIRGCPEVSQWPVRCVVTSPCGSATSDTAIFTIWTTCIAGDLNCDGTVDNSDIDAFVMALLDAGAYHEAFPACNILNADINADGVVDNSDIDPFVDCLLAGGCG